MSRRGAEKEGDTEFEAGSSLQAVTIKPNVGPKPTDHEIMSWAKVGHLNDWAIQEPLNFLDSIMEI